MKLSDAKQIPEERDADQRERMLRGELYFSADAGLVEERHRARRLCRAYNATTEEQGEERFRLLKELLGGTGKTLTIEPEFICDYGTYMTVGENFYANFGLVVLDTCPVCIGNNCMFGPRVSLFTAGHPLDPDVRNSGWEFGAPITIGDNVWIGGGSIINPGVTLGNNVVVGSGSVVTKSFGDNVVIAGNPARVIRELASKE